ncbi:MAG: cupin domain-containing protein [Gammaproteobacteria bacterium]|nr:cupin domain-containing protein [Gammaproteobacteria bacterium]
MRFEPYDLEGELQPDMAFLPLSYDRERDVGTYMIRMEPGAETIGHTHARIEEFLILEGQLIEDDGTVLRPGDYVSFSPGTRHNSRTEQGCLLIGFDWAG